MSYDYVHREIVETRSVHVVTCDGCGKQEPELFSSHQSFPYDWYYIGGDYDPLPEARRYGHACSIACAHVVLDKLPTTERRVTGWR